MSKEKINLLKQYGRNRLNERLVFTKFFDVPVASSWKASKQRKKSAAKKKKEQEKSGCTSSGQAATAVICKTGDWNGNFSYYIRSGEGKTRAKQYQTISPALARVYAKRYPLVIQFANSNFKLDSVDCNFNTKCYRKRLGKRITPGSKKPYAWEGHHMIPGDAFTQIKAAVGGDKSIFDEKQLDLLLLSDYDVNAGTNLIALPTNGMDAFQLVHCLLQHPSDHQNYTTEVVEQMRGVAKELDKLNSEADKPHPNINVKVGEAIRIKEKQLWKLIVKLSKAKIYNVIKLESTSLSSEAENIIKTSAGSGVKYPLGALG